MGRRSATLVVIVVAIAWLVLDSMVVVAGHAGTRALTATIGRGYDATIVGSSVDLQHARLTRASRTYRDIDVEWCNDHGDCERGPVTTVQRLPPAEDDRIPIRVLWGRAVSTTTPRVVMGLVGALVGTGFGVVVASVLSRILGGPSNPWRRPPSVHS